VRDDDATMTMSLRRLSSLTSLLVRFFATGRADDNRHLRTQRLKPLGAVDVITVEIAAS